MHTHNPSQYTNSWRRFLSFLCHPLKVRSYSLDGEDYCRVCGQGILVPEFYFSLFWNAVYFVISLAIVYFAMRCKSPVLMYLWPVLVLVFHHITASAIFAFLPWGKYDREKFSPKYANSRAKKDSRIKYACIFIGAVVALAIWRVTR